ncbi:MAG: penicillin-binding protein activator [Gammaproteobacteria bacterium]|nr:penicillin-binding protein activator [Gammaproteobacteria bacterium]
MQPLRPATILILLVLIISACSTIPDPEVRSSQAEIPPTFDSIEGLINLANNSSQPQSSVYLVEALELMLLERQTGKANELIEQLSRANSLNNNLQIRLAIIRSELSLDRDDPQSAIRWLSGALIDDLAQQSSEIQQRVFQLRAQAYIATNQSPEAALQLILFNSSQFPNQSQSTHDQIWQILEQLTDHELMMMASSADSYEVRGWVELTRLIRSKQYSITDQLEAINRWRSIWARHSAATLVPDNLVKLEQVWAQRPTHIALLLPLQDQAGKAVQEGFLSAYYQALGADTQVPHISVFDTSGLTLISGIYDTAVESGADLIIGPLNKELVQQLNSMPELPIPTLALNYTDLQSRNSTKFFQFGLAPGDEIEHAANLAWGAGHRNAAIVAPEHPDYQQLQQVFARHWRGLGGELVSSASFSSDTEYADLIKQLLAINASEARAQRIIDLLPRNEVEFIPRRRADIDFIFLMANPRQGRQIKPTLAFYFAGDIPVYALPAINDGATNQIGNQDLNGIVFPDTPWVLNQDDPLKQQVTETLRPAQGPLQRLRALGIDSFRLYPRLTQFTNSEISSFHGATGILSMSDFGRFKRIPLSAMFVDGLAVLLEDGNTLVDP